MKIKPERFSSFCLLLHLPPLGGGDVKRTGEGVQKSNLSRVSGFMTRVDPIKEHWGTFRVKGLGFGVGRYRGAHEEIIRLQGLIGGR